MSAPVASLPAAELAAVVARALDEDLGGDPGRDVTTQATIAPGQVSQAHVVARADGVVAGLGVWPVVLRQVADRLGLPVPTVVAQVNDGDLVRRGDVLAALAGRTQVLLVAERTGLNVMSRLSGIATHTRAWAQALAGTGATVLDTRKTTPGLRALEKYAVRVGGGTNKRMGLYDVAMVKDNHKLAAGSVAAAYAAVRSAFPEVPVQVEVTTVAEALEATRAGARFLLCDNMGVPALRQVVAAVRHAAPGVELEATGGLTLDQAAQVGRTGVDYLSVGALTHSSPVLDVALDLVVG